MPSVRLNVRNNQNLDDITTMSTCSADVELGDDILNGYPGLAKQMGEYRGLNMFSRFAKLSARNLMYMQAEILHLERKLHVVTWADHRDGAKRIYERNATALMRSIENEDSQWELFLEIREKLKEYSKLLHPD